MRVELRPKIKGGAQAQEGPEPQSLAKLGAVACVTCFIIT